MLSNTMNEEVEIIQQFTEKNSYILQSQYQLQLLKDAALQQQQQER